MHSRGIQSLPQQAKEEYSNQTFRSLPGSLCKEQLEVEQSHNQIGIIRTPWNE